PRTKSLTRWETSMSGFTPGARLLMGPGDAPGLGEARLVREAQAAGWLPVGGSRRADSSARRGRRRWRTRPAACRRRAQSDRGSADGTRTRTEIHPVPEPILRWHEAVARARRRAGKRATRAYTGAGANGRWIARARVPRFVPRT